MTAKARISAINRFISGCKADNIYNDLQAACVMAGWDGLAGALTPLVGASPTNNGFLDADFDRGIGLKGDGSSKYLGSNRANNADGQNDQHVAVYSTTMASGNESLLGSSSIESGATVLQKNGGRCRSTTFSPSALTPSAGFAGFSRNVGSSYRFRTNGENEDAFTPSQSPGGSSLLVFARGTDPASSFSDPTLSFYSIGSSLGSDPATGLAALDVRVSQLMADLRAIEEDGFDADAVAYIRNVETADAAYLETSVKTAINSLVVGLKSDGLWESLKASCLLCGPRTLAGALVPLRGVAPTAVAFTDGDYSRSAGLTGDGATTYLNSNRANDADPQDDNHNAIYLSAAETATDGFEMGAGAGAGRNMINATVTNNVFARCRDATEINTGLSGIGSGVIGMSRSDSSGYTVRSLGSEYPATAPADGVASENVFVFAGSNAGSPFAFSSSTLSFYSLGSSLDLALLDTHVSNYVTAIGASV